MSHSYRVHDSRRIAALLGACGLCALSACASADELSLQADRAVDGEIGGSVERLNDQRRATVVEPEKQEPPPPAAEPAAESAALTTPPAGPPPPETRVLTLTEALKIAIESNREYITQKEALYQTALSLTGTRHSFAPQITSSLSYLFSGGEHVDNTQSAFWTAAVTKVLPTGGDISVAGSTSLSTTDNPAASDPNTFNSDLAVVLRQPLLRGAGREVAYEDLVQAERSLVYEIRNFELFRENFSIDVATKYYELVRDKQGLVNQRHNLDGLVFARRQAEALNKVDRLSELEVLRARRSELTSQNTMIEAQESYRLALDKFRIFLGLPPGMHIEVQEDPPKYVEVNYDVDSAVQVAQKNRLDVLNRTEQLEDVERNLRISRNGLLPEVNLDVQYGLAGKGDPSFVHQGVDQDSWGAGIRFELPIDRLTERNAYRTAEIQYIRAKRDYEVFMENLIVDVQSTFRGLVRSTQSLEIQRQLIVDQEKNVKIAQIRLEQGVVSNREVLDAQESLLDARNALIQEQVDYEISRLGLFRDLGILFIDEHGMWNQ